MTMQVSKGEFDRRVKLLEQQVKTSTNDLINRLQAESEAFIEKLRNTQLDIEDLREQIEHINPNDPEIDNILNNFVRGYNNFASNTLRINDVFDADGQFDGSRIRPLSIETAALSVGTRSQQLALNGIEFRVLPYTKSSSGSDRNGYIQIVSSQHTKSGANFTGNSLAGYIFHYGYGTDTNAIIYKINEKQELLTSTNKYYIYAQFVTSNSSVYEKVNNIDIVYFYSYIEKLYTYSNPNYSRVYVDGDSYSHYDSNVDYYVVQGDNLANAEINSKNDFLRKINDLYTITEVEVSGFTQSEDYYYFSEKITNVLVKEESEEPRAGVQYYIKSKLSLPTFNSSTDYYINKTEDIITNTSTTEGNAQEATILISQNQIQTKDNSYPNKLTVKLGYIGQEMSTTNGRYERKVDMTYGQTTIDGRLITTGRIEGNGAWFDLDQGKIGGNIEFTQGNTNGLLSLIGGASQADLNNLEIGGRNILLNSGVRYSNNAYNITDYIPSSYLVAGEVYTVSIKITPASDVSYICPYLSGGYVPQAYMYVNGTSTQIIKSTFTARYFDGRTPSDNPFYGRFQIYRFPNNGSSAGVTTIDWIKVEKGNKATDWSPAPEDMEEGGWVSKSKVLYYRNTSNSIPSIPTLDSSTQTIVYTKSGITWTDDINSLAPTKTNITNFWIYKCQISYKEKDSKVKDFSCTNAVYDDAMTTNLIAMQGSTTIAGGLILSSKIIVKDENNANNCAVLNGTDEYAFYAGDQNHNSAPVWIKRNGTARFQNLFFNGSVIANKETNPEFGIHTISISPSFNKEYKNTQINSQTSFSVGLTQTNVNTYYSVNDLEEFGPFNLIEVNSGYLSFNIEFDYKISIGGSGANKNGSLGFYLKYGSNRKSLSVEGTNSFNPQTSVGDYYGHCSENGIKFTGLTSSNYNYGLQFLLSENGNISNVSIYFFNIKISCQNTVPNLDYGFHIYTNGIVFYKNDSNYFILYDSGSSGLKCLNSLGF